MSVSVVIADDHAVVREGIITLLRNSDVTVVGEASDGKQAVELTLSKQPDVLLLDVRMGSHGGIETLEELQQHETKTRVLMLSNYDNPTYVARSIALGAHGYQLKDGSRDDLLRAIHAVVRGEPAPEDQLFGRIQSLMKKRKEDKEGELPLTVREMQVLRHIALGLSNREIGFSLGISVETVKEHVQNILRKVDATDRTHAAVWAVKKQLV